jgi:AcrR family transcriptional regulator
MLLSMPATSRQQTGLRERKRQLTRTSIERTAAALCVEHGYENVTVEMICAATSVSSSTFFNYFGSKDAAVLGDPPSPSPDAQAAFLAGTGPVLHDLLDLLLAPILESAINAELFATRARVIARSPRLAARENARFDELDDTLANLVEQRARRRGGTPRPVRETRMVVTLGTSVLRHLVHRLREDPTLPLRDEARDALRLAGRIARAEI